MRKMRAFYSILMLASKNANKCEAPKIAFLGFWEPSEAGSHLEGCNLIFSAQFLP